MIDATHFAHRVGEHPAAIWRLVTADLIHAQRGPRLAFGGRGAWYIDNKEADRAERLIRFARQHDLSVTHVFRMDRTGQLAFVEEKVR